MCSGVSFLLQTATRDKPWEMTRLVITTNGTYHVVICDTDIP